MEFPSLLFEFNRCLLWTSILFQLVLENLLFNIQPLTVFSYIIVYLTIGYRLLPDFIMSFIIVSMFCITLSLLVDVKQLEGV